MVCPGPLVASSGTVAGLDLAYVYLVYRRPAEGPFELNVRPVADSHRLTAGLKRTSRLWSRLRDPVTAFSWKESVS